MVYSVCFEVPLDLTFDFTTYFIFNYNNQYKTLNNELSLIWQVISEYFAINLFAFLRSYDMYRGSESQSE